MTDIFTNAVGHFFLRGSVSSAIPPDTGAKSLSDGETVGLVASVGTFLMLAACCCLGAWARHHIQRVDHGEAQPLQEDGHSRTCFGFRWVS